MQFRRSGQRDDRRRRVFGDSHLLGEELARARRRSRRSSEPDRPVRKSRNYGDAEFMDHEPRLIDLVPTKLGVILVLFVVGLLAVAGLEGLYASMPRFAAFTHDGRVASFDLDDEGSLAVWFSSMTLATAGVVSLLVFRVRRHRSDDYSGRYRIWLWAAACWFLMSLDETASLHEGFKQVMTTVTGTAVYGDGSVWWVVPYFFLLGAVGIRLVLDMRECRLSTAAMLSTAGCFALAVLTQLGLVMPESGARGVMLEEGAEMVGDLFLLLAMTLHARHVILDAEGVLPERKKRTRPVFEEEETEEEAAERFEREYDERHGYDEDEDEYDEEAEEAAAEMRALWGQQVKVHPPHGLKGPAGKRARKKKRSSQTVSKTSSVSDEDLQSASGVTRKLTKAEKKALRRRLQKAAQKRRQQGG